MQPKPDDGLITKPKNREASHETDIEYKSPTHANEDEAIGLARDSASESAKIPKEAPSSCLPAKESACEATSEPATDPASDPVKIPEEAPSSRLPARESSCEATSEPATEPASDPVKIPEEALSSRLPASESACEATSEPATDPASEPAKIPKEAPSSRLPASESACEATSEPATDPASDPAKKPEGVPSTRCPPPQPSKKPAKREGSVAIVSDGDLLLHVGDPNEWLVTFIVCFKTLARASKMFEIMLLRAFGERGPQDDDKPWVLSLPGDSNRPMNILLNIAHARFHRVDDVLPLADLGMVAALSRKYEMTNMLSPWARRWVQHDAVRRGRRGDLRLLHIAWEFGDRELYAETMTTVILYCEVSAQGRLGYAHSRHNLSADDAGGGLVADGVWDYRHCERSNCGCISHVEHLRPPDLRQRIINCRETLLNDKFLPICRLAASLKEGICRARDHDERYRCRAMAIGSLSVSCEKLATAGITIMPKPSLPLESSIAVVNDQLAKSFNIKALCETCNAQIKDTLDMCQSDFDRAVKNLELWSADDLQKMATQARKTGVSDPGQWPRR